MKNNGFFKTAAALLAALVLLGGFSVPAYAGGGEDIPTDDSGVIVETEPQPLTPDGNLSLIDDIEGEAAKDKQFIIVQSKNGNYFYIIVDRAAEGENTVHFLNQVDEADLMALMEDGSGKAQAPAVCTCKDKCKAGAVNTACPVCSVNMTECVGNAHAPHDVHDLAVFRLQLFLLQLLQPGLLFCNLGLDLFDLGLDFRAFADCHIQKSSFINKVCRRHIDGTANSCCSDWRS